MADARVGAHDRWAKIDARSGKGQGRKGADQNVKPDEAEHANSPGKGNCRCDEQTEERSKQDNAHVNHLVLLVPRFPQDRKANEK